MPVFSISAGIARIIALAIPQFWLVILLVRATGGRVDESLWISASLVILVLCAGVMGLLFSLKFPETRARMRVGPRALADWRLAVLTAGSASIAGGVAIFESSSRLSATIATALGAVVVALEGLAIIGSIGSPRIRPQDIPRRNEPVEIPGWALPASFALVVVVLSLANQFFAG
jgi:hypothetical protein